jgi:hypothetical protein
MLTKINITIYVESCGTLNINEGEITGNNAEFVGGGVYVSTGAILLQKNGDIRSNTAGDGDGENIFKQ